MEKTGTESSWGRGTGMAKQGKQDPPGADSAAGKADKKPKSFSFSSFFSFLFNFSKKLDASK